MTRLPKRSGRKLHRPDRHASGFGAALLLALLVACSAGLEWRQLRLADWRVAVSLPCKPDRQVRRVPLAGAPVELTLLACSAEGHTFAIASADLADPARVGPALLALGDAARANVQGRIIQERPAQVPGMTPYAAAKRWRLQGRLPDGQAVAEQVLVFAYGTRVFQATVVGPRADATLAGPLLDAIEVLR
jgi:hypothetical protein